MFGELGYEPTTIAQIEAAAGLSPGSGGLYRHFRSKEQVLREGVLAQVASVADLAAFIDDPDGLAQMPIRAQLAALARAGLRRMDSKRDLNRILHRRDLTPFPDLLTALRDDDLARVFRGVTGWFVNRAGGAGGGRDWPAIGAVLVGSVAHYWLIRDAIGRHPDNIETERFVEAWAELAASVLVTGAASPDPPGTGAKPRTF